MTPADRASAAASRARSSTRAGSKVAACASGTGAIVRWPWITSSPMRIGMPSRVSSTAARCSALAAAADRGQNIEPIPSRTRDAASSSCGRKTICSWPSFSCPGHLAQERLDARAGHDGVLDRTAWKEPQPRDRSPWAAAVERPGSTRPRPRPSRRAPGRPSSDRSAGPARRRRARRTRPGSARWRSGRPMKAPVSSSSPIGSYDGSERRRVDARDRHEAGQLGEGLPTARAAPTQSRKACADALTASSDEALIAHA